MKSLHLVTGASRGLGLGVAKHFIGRGDTVVSLARSKSGYGGLREEVCDLGDAVGAAQVLRDVLASYRLADFNRVTLVNNSGMVEPIGPSTDLNVESIAQSATVNFTSALTLTTAFLRATRDFRGLRAIVNVSSGVAKRPKSGWAVYSAAKAGLEAHSKALQAEFAGTTTRVVIFNPGVMDTAMQGVIRATPEGAFADRQRFVDLKQNGQLRSPDLVGSVVARVALGELGGDDGDVAIDQFV